MNKNFANWYRSASLEPESEQLNNRWQGIVYFIENELDKQNILDLVMLFYKKQVNEEFREKYIDCFVKYDSAFNRDADHEINVLAGATIIAIIENHDYAMIGILATISFSFLENKSEFLPILQIVREKFIKESSSIREKILCNEKSAISYQEPKNLIKLLENKPSWGDDVITSLVQYVKEVDKSFKSINKINQEHKEVQNIYCEDSQILWWMTGEWSNDLNKSFSHMKDVEACLYIGKELADKVSVLPGPYSSKVIIYKMLGCCKKSRVETISLKDVIDKSDAEWRLACIKKYDISNINEITPIMYAISKSLTVDAGDDWNPQFKRTTKYSSEDIIKSVEDISFQVYLECLTIKCYTDIEE